MRKFTANYLLSDSGVFLKNGIVIAEDDGTVMEYRDTAGDLKEIEQMSFHNGILIAGFTFSKDTGLVPLPEADNTVRSFVILSVTGMLQFSIHDFIESGKQIQDHFPEMIIPEIMNEMAEILVADIGFKKEKTPGIFLLSGVDLPHMHFTQQTRIKRIL
ncbi:MAG: hypothetical protein WCI54_08830 [Bacteroidia bacterium]